MSAASSPVHAATRTSCASVLSLKPAADSMAQAGTMALSILSICIGASCGALLRWLLAMQLNKLFPAIPPGTLAANLIGGYLIGVVVSVFAQMPGLAPEWRLFTITGLLGALTTFSTFSSEVVSHLNEGRMLVALTAIAVHVVGSLAMTLAGIGTVTWVRSM